MNKDTLLEEVRKVELALNLAERYDDIDYYLADSVWHLIDCINKLDEPQKPIIPQFVADYIEKWEHEGLTIYEWFSFGNDDVDEDVNKWLYDNTMEENRRREYLLVNAIRNGYEVEKEKKYEVTIGKGTWGGHTSVVVLYKSVGETMVLREMSQEYYEDSKRRAPTSFWLTEKEIKDYDKRYWVFAEEVTE